MAQGQRRIEMKTLFISIEGTTNSNIIEKFWEEAQDVLGGIVWTDLSNSSNMGRNILSMARKAEYNVKKELIQILDHDFSDVYIMRDDRGNVLCENYITDTMAEGYEVPDLAVVIVAEGEKEPDWVGSMSANAYLVLPEVGEWKEVFRNAVEDAYNFKM